MRRQDNLHTPRPGVIAFATWGDDLVDTTHLLGDGLVEVGPIGAAPKRSDVAVLGADGILPAGHRLARRQGCEVFVHVPDDTQACLHGGGGSSQRLPPGEETPLAKGELVEITVGAHRICLARDALGIALKRHAAVDWNLARVGAISGLTHGLLMTAAAITPAEMAFGPEALQRRPDFKHVIFKPAPPPPPAQKTKLASLQRGPQPAPKRPLQKGPRSRPTLSPKAQRDAVKKTGLLALLSQGSLASSTVLGSPALGGELQAAMAGLQGPRSLAAGGLGGLRSRGGGSGGGDGSVAIGSLHTRSGSGLPAASLGVGRHKSVRLLSPRTVLGEGLGRTDVSRVMRRNRARFKFCYERQLNRHPELQGKLSVRFTIAPDGRVAKVALQESTLHNAEVEGCVQSVVGSLRFPKPRGGGVVVVSYPFLFAQSN